MTLVQYAVGTERGLGRERYSDDEEGPEPQKCQYPRPSRRSWFRLCLRHYPYFALCFQRKGRQNPCLGALWACCNAPSGRISRHGEVVGGAVVRVLRGAARSAAYAASGPPCTCKISAPVQNHAPPARCAIAPSGRINNPPSTGPQQPGKKRKRGGVACKPA